MKNRGRFLIAVVLIFLFGCDQSNNGKILKFSGTLELTEHSLGAKGAGRLTTLSVKEGDQVKQGQVLGTLDRYEQTKKDYERSCALVNEGGATRQSLEYASLAMEDQQIVSPVDGDVLVKVREVGEVLAAGSAVVVVGDRNDLWVKIFVPEGKVNKIKMDQPAVVRFDGLDQTFQGHVSYIATRAEFTPRNVQTPEERITQTFAVKIKLENPPGYLRPGVAADVSLDLDGI